MHKVAHIARPITGVGRYISTVKTHLNSTLFKTYLIGNIKEETPLSKIEINQQFHVELQRKINLITDTRCLFQIIKQLKKIKPDLIHCHSAKAGMLGRLAGAYLKIPTVYTPHAYSYLSARNTTKKRFFKFIEKSFKHAPSKTLACSPSEYERTLKDLNFKKDKVLIWNNSIEPYVTKETSEIDRSLPNRFLCAIVRVSYQKNVEMLLSTLGHLKNKNIEISLILIGVNNLEQQKLQTLIDNYQIADCVKCIPWLDKSELMYILDRSFLYVSSSRYEGLPYAVLEAMSVAKPGVVTNVDGNNDLIIDGYNGYLVETEDAIEMAKKIEKLLDNPASYKTMSLNAKIEFSEKYSIEKNIKNLEKIYLSQIIKGR